MSKWLIYNYYFDQLTDLKGEYRNTQMNGNDTPINRSKRLQSSRFRLTRAYVRDKHKLFIWFGLSRSLRWISEQNLTILKFNMFTNFSPINLHRWQRFFFLVVSSVCLAVCWGKHMQICKYLIYQNIKQNKNLMTHFCLFVCFCLVFHRKRTQTQTHAHHFQLFTLNCFHKIYKFICTPNAKKTEKNAK